MKNKEKMSKRLKKISIGNRITLFYTGIFTVTLLLMTVFIMINAGYYYGDVSRQEMEETAAKVEDYIKSGGEISISAISQMNPNKNVEIRVININNNRRFDIMNEPGNFPPPPEDFEKSDGEKNNTKQKHFEKEIIKGIPYMYHKNIVSFNGEKYFVEVFRPNYKEQKVLRIFGMIFVFANILGIIASFSIGRFISRKLLNPITEISKTAERISINDLSQRIIIHESDDEIRTLAVTFNDMIERLEISFEKQKQFISDASHELKTPISVIQGYANLIDRWGKSDPGILQESIDSIKDETEHMGTLIKKLLFLAKSEQNEINVQKEKLNLNIVLSEVIKEINVIDVKPDISVMKNEDIYIFGDFNLIKQMLWIFIDNAVKYSDKNDGKIDISITSDGCKAVVTVSDNGAGIKQEDVPHIFDRFYRGDKSRSKTTPGTGLGLAIAELIIKQHGGNVEVLSEEGKGTVFIVRFPIYDFAKKGDEK